MIRATPALLLKDNATREEAYLLENNVVNELYQPVEQVEQFKYLGTIIDQTLTF